MMCIFIIFVKGIYFDQIKVGMKIEEYCLVIDYWKMCLFNKDYDVVVLMCGYLYKDVVDCWLCFLFLGWQIKKIIYFYFGVKFVEVFVIDVIGKLL